jgi:long-chain acyl-CoA synthetase
MPYTMDYNEDNMMLQDKAYTASQDAYRPSTGAHPGPIEDNVLLRRSKALVVGAQHFLYHRFLDVHVFGGGHVPQNGGFLVAANHVSHLDAGLVKAALAERGSQLWALAAQDYFFAHPWRRWYFENFTRVLPIARGGNFKAALKRAVATVKNGDPLLIFPEGTRSLDGSMAPFKPAISSMALMADCPILPIYLWGTYEAMPKGSLLVPVARRMGAVIGPAIPAEALRTLTEGLPKSQAYRVATQCVEMAVRALQEGRPVTLDSLLARARLIADAQRVTEQGAEHATVRTGAQVRSMGVRGIA